ncbi:hypothetical protein Trydic_g14887 [Trypoxylus dichotomus]
MLGRLPYSVSLQSASFHSGSHSSISCGSKPADYILKRDRWRSSGSFIISMLAYCVTSNAYASFIKSEGRNDPNFLQYFLSFLLFGMPIVYMQIALGQYTQMGMFYFKYCIPLFKGLAYTFMVCVLLQTILAGFIMTDKLMYFLLTFQTTLPWSQCPDEYEGLCIVNSTRLPHTSNFHKSYVFWRYVYMEDPVLQLADVSTYDIPSTQRIVALLTTWIVTFGIVCVSYRYHRKFIHWMVFIYIFGNFIVFLAIVTKKGAVLGLSKLLEMRVEDFYSAAAWNKTVTVAIGGLALAELYHMYAGSFLHQSAQPGALSVGCVFSLLLLKILLSAICTMCEGLIVYHSNAQTLDASYNISKYTVAVFVTIPQGLSYLSLPQLWTFFYFGSNIIISICNQVLHLISMQVAITDMYPNFHKFRVYVFGVICIFSAFIGLCVLPECVFAISQVVFTDVLIYTKCGAVLILSIMIFWVYGVSNLSDDIHFLMGSQPTKYWKICWCLCPLVVLVTLVYLILRALSKRRTYFIIATAGSFVLLSPTVVFIVIELLQYIRKRNLLGTIRPTEFWGPPDPDDRALRRMFNPRLETRYQAHKMVCEHSCLFGNKDLQHIIDQENVSRREYLKKALAEISKSTALIEQLKMKEDDTVEFPAVTVGEVHSALGTLAATVGLTLIIVCCCCSRPQG